MRAGTRPRPEIDIRWQEFAACHSAPRGLFFPDTRTWDDPAVQEFVRDVTAAYCIGCPVRLECLTHALTFPERDGVWAGSTPPQRHAATKAGRTPEQLLLEIETQEVPPLAPEEMSA